MAVDTETIVLEKDLCLSGVSVLYAQLQEFINSQNKRNYLINGADVENIDTAALQLLALFLQEIQINGSQISWEQPTQTLIEASRTLGLASHLQLTRPETGILENG